MVSFFKWLGTTYKTLTFAQWAFALPIGSGGLAATPIIGVFYEWPLWVQALASASVALIWLTVFTWLVNFVTRNPKMAPTRELSQEDSPNAQQAATGRDSYQAQRDIIINVPPKVPTLEPDPKGPALKVRFRDYQWGTPELLIERIRKTHFQILRVAVDFTPSNSMQIARATLHYEDQEIPAKGLTPFTTNSPTTESFRFEIGGWDKERGPVKAKVVIVAATETWETEEFELQFTRLAWSNLSGLESQTDAKESDNLRRTPQVFSLECLGVQAELVRTSNGALRSLRDNRETTDNTLVLTVGGHMDAIPSVLVEGIWLRIGDRDLSPVPAWEGERISGSEDFNIDFDIPKDVGRGLRKMKLVAMVDGERRCSAEVEHELPLWRS